MEKDGVNTHTAEYCSVIKENEITPSAATRMDLESQRTTSTVRYHLYVGSLCGILNMIQVNLLAKQKQTHRHRKQIDGYQREKR